MNLFRKTTFHMEDNDRRRADFKGETMIPTILPIKN